MLIMTGTELDSYVSEISMSDYVASFTNSTINRVGVSDPTYFRNVSGIINGTKRSALRDFFRFSLFKSWARAVRDNELSGLLSSVTSNQLRSSAIDFKSLLSTFCTWDVHEKFPWLLSAAYIDRHFSPEIKLRGQQMLGEVEIKFAEHLMILDWMSGDAKEAAHRKSSCCLRG
jgi:predicted metalloendopeptidase